MGSRTSTAIPAPSWDMCSKARSAPTLKGEHEAVYYTAGQSFYEAPSGIHQVSANASDKRPARFLAYFICDRETPLSIPVPNQEK